MNGTQLGSESINENYSNLLCSIGRWLFVIWLPTEYMAADSSRWQDDKCKLAGCLTIIKCLIEFYVKIWWLGPVAIILVYQHVINHQHRACTMITDDAQRSHSDAFFVNCDEWHRGLIHSWMRCMLTVYIYRFGLPASQQELVYCVLHWNMTIICRNGIDKCAVISFATWQ